jgi:subtilisin family serine protease
MILAVIMVGSTATIITSPFQIALAQNATSTTTTATTGPEELAIIPGQFIVSFKDPAELSQGGMSAAASVNPAPVLTESLESQGITASINKSLPALNAAVVNIELSPQSNVAGAAAGDEQAATDLVIKQLEQNPVVESAQADMKMTAIPPIAVNPNATASAIQARPSGIDRIDGENIPPLVETSNADIAIVDSGVKADHEDLNVFRSVSFTGTSTDDICGHGTHVAGSAAAKNNSVGVVGAAPGARIWNVKVLESEDPSDPDARCSASLGQILDGLNFVAENSDTIDVVNLSLGGFCPLTTPGCNTPVYENAINNLVDRGVVVVVAAGNNAGPAEEIVPARFANAITVSAISDSDGKCGAEGEPLFFGDADDTFASYSNFGPLIDIAAPGSDIPSTWNDGGYNSITGTSMASPHVAGEAAKIKAENPEATASDVNAALLTSATTEDAQCDGNGHGYFTDDVDGISEPLLYGKNASASAPTSGINSTISNSTMG